MRITVILTLMICAAGLLSACKPAHYGHPHGCPPGQAKKGNC